MAEIENVQSRFSPNEPLEPDVLAELLSIMRLHDLTAEDLFFKWESYCIKLDMDTSAVSLQNVRNLKQGIYDELEKNQRQAHVKQERKMGPSSKVSSSKTGDVFGMLDGLVPSTPAAGKGALGGPLSKKKKKAEMKNEPASSPSAGMTDQLKSMNVLGNGHSFSERVNPGEIVEILNDSIAASEAPMAPFSEPRVKLTAASDQKKLAYKPLAMKLSEASEILDDRIDDFMAIAQELHRLDDDALGSAANQSTTEIVAVGRIASDVAEGRLNAASVVLETSRRMGRGFRVPLNMSKIKAWSFFPGQIVALRGSNKSGHEFVVSEILELPLLPSAASAPSALQSHREKLRGDADGMDADSEPTPLSIYYAAGPYTADDNLDYEPLHALCNQAADNHVDALILTGPFLDADHPLIATGDFDLPEDAAFDPDTATMSTVFKYLFAPALHRLAKANPSVTIVLVPSVRDVIDKHVSWPQDVISRRELGLPKAARLVSNPMTLSINEAVLGISSQDVLYELRSEEVVSGAAGSDLLGRLCRYLVEQRHFFPLFPPADRRRLPKTGTEDGTATGAMLDVSYLKLGEMFHIRPDIMVLPSGLPPFAKVVESVVAINPGFLSKRRGAGTYARMWLQAPSTQTAGADEGSLVGHRVFERARVEIVRI